MTVTPAPRPITNATTGALPPAELRALLPDLDAATEHLEELRLQRRQVRADLDAGQSERRRAEHADIQAAADAVREGKADPGSPSVERVDARLAELRRRDTVLAAAIDSAGRDLADLIDQHRAAWLAKLDATAGKRRHQARELAEQWAALRWELAQVDALRRWVAGFPSRPFTVSRRLHGSTDTIDSLRAALVADAGGEASGDGDDVLVGGEAA